MSDCAINKTYTRSMQSSDRQIDLFCKLESPDRIHAVIADVLMEGAVRSLQVMVCNSIVNIHHAMMT